MSDLKIKVSAELDTPSLKSIEQKLKGTKLEAQLSIDDAKATEAISKLKASLEKGYTLKLNTKNLDSISSKLQKAFDKSYTVKVDTKNIQKQISDAIKNATGVSANISKSAKASTNANVNSQVEKINAQKQKELEVLAAKNEAAQIQKQNQLEIINSKAQASINVAREKQQIQIENEQRKKAEAQAAAIAKQQAAQAQQIVKQQQQYQKRVSNLQTNVLSGNYDVSFAKMNAKVRTYTGMDLDAEVADSLERAKGHLKEFEDNYQIILKSIKDGKITLDDEAFVSCINNMENAAKKFGNQMSIVSADMSGYIDTNKAIASSNKMLSWLNENTKAAKKYGDTIRQLAESMKGATTKSEYSKYLSEFNEITSRAKKEDLTGKTAWGEIKRGFQQIGQFVGTYGVWQQAVDGLRDMLNNVREIDSAMTSLYKVTDETDAKYEQFLTNASKHAQELGRSISGYIEQAADWAKLGFSIDESEELAKSSSIYANVGEVDDATAVSDMITAMKSFSIQASDSMSIIDSFNALGNQFAVSSADLGEGLSNAASSLALAGNDINQSLAMITGMSEIDIVSIYSNVYALCA